MTSVFLYVGLFLSYAHPFGFWDIMFQSCVWKHHVYWPSMSQCTVVDCTPANPHNTNCCTRFSWGVPRTPVRPWGTLGRLLVYRTAIPSLTSAPREGSLRRQEEGGTAEASRSRLLNGIHVLQLMFVSDLCYYWSARSSKFCSIAMHSARNLRVFCLDASLYTLDQCFHGNATLSMAQSSLTVLVCS